MPRSVRLALVALGVFLVQWLLLGRIGLLGAVPDAVLLYVAWLSLREGRRVGVIAGFLLGFLLDATYETWGVHMFVDSLIGFLVGLFPASERETVSIQPYQALLGGFVIALVHGGLVTLFTVLDTQARSVELLAGGWLGSALYTGMVAYVAAQFQAR
jgi:rod shape-determining protein MreD